MRSISVLVLYIGCATRKCFCAFCKINLLAIFPFLAAKNLHWNTNRDRSNFLSVETQGELQPHPQSLRLWQVHLFCWHFWPSCVSLCLCHLRCKCRWRKDMFCRKTSLLFWLNCPDFASSCAGKFIRNWDKRLAYEAKSLLNKPSFDILVKWSKVFGG